MHVDKFLFLILGLSFVCCGQHRSVGSFSREELYLSDDVKDAVLRGDVEYVREWASSASKSDITECLRFAVRNQKLVIVNILSKKLQELRKEVSSVCFENRNSLLQGQMKNERDETSPGVGVEMSRGNAQDIEFRNQPSRLVADNGRFLPSRQPSLAVNSGNKPVHRYVTGAAAYEIQDMKPPEGLRVPQKPLDIDGLSKLVAKSICYKGKVPTGKCLFCDEKEATMFAVTCGHLVICEDCAKKNEEGNSRPSCPLCRVPIQACSSCYKEKSCVICLDAECDTVLLPCGHQCVCYVDSVRLWTEKRQCPMCQARIKSFRHVFPIYPASDDFLADFKSAVDEGDAEDKLRYGYMLEKGLGVNKNLEEAARYYKMAADQGNSEGEARYYRVLADQGNPDGQWRYGRMLENGECLHQDLRKAARYYKMSADQGNTEAQLKYGEMLEKGIGISQDLKDAARYYKMAADQGLAEGQLSYGKMLYSQDLKEAARYFKMSADQGNTEAQCKYGRMLEYDKGVSQNLQEACRYYKMAADQGNSEGQWRYGRMLANGEGFHQDLREAARYYQMSADQGNAEGQWRYGRMLENGRGVVQDLKDAVRYYRMSADLGHTKAQLKYGYMLEYGRGVPRNIENAARYYNMAADQGNAEAQYRYGCMLENSRGVPENIKRAARYYKMSADQDNSESLWGYGNMLYFGRGVPQDCTEGLRYIQMSADKGHLSAGSFITRRLDLS